MGRGELNAIGKVIRDFKHLGEGLVNCACIPDADTHESHVVQEQITRLADQIVDAMSKDIRSIKVEYLHPLTKTSLTEKGYNIVNDISGYTIKW